MPFIEMHFKERNLQRCFWLFTSLSNSYDKSFSQKKMFGKVLNRALISFLTIVNTIKGLLKMPKIFPVQANVAYIFLIDLYSQRQRERETERERERERDRVA